MANLPADYKAQAKAGQGGILESGITPRCGIHADGDPAERARESEAQRMAQQYGGNDMGLAIMEEAPGKTPEDLVKYYQAQRGAGEDQDDEAEDGPILRYAASVGFADSQFGGEKAAQMFVDQNPDIAFGEFNKNVPLEVISDGDEQSSRFASKGMKAHFEGEGWHGYEH